MRGEVDKHTKATAFQNKQFQYPGCCIAVDCENILTTVHVKSEKKRVQMYRLVRLGKVAAGIEATTSSRQRKSPQRRASIDHSEKHL